MRLRHLMIAGVLAASLPGVAPLIAPAAAFADNSVPLEQDVKVEVFTNRSGAPNRVADRSWYGGSFVFSRSYTTNSQYYDGSSVGIEVTASCPVDGSFTVALYRNGTFISTASLNRNGFSRAEWTNVGSGSYSFRFSKSADGATLRCTDVAMFSW